MTRRPALTAATAAIAMLALATPALHLKTTDGALRQFPKGNETLRGFQAAAAVTGPGASSPFEVIAPKSEAATVRRVLAADPRGAERAAPTIVSSNGQRSTDPCDSAPRRRVSAGPGSREAPTRAPARGRTARRRRPPIWRLPRGSDRLDVEGGAVRDDGDLLRADAVVALDRAAAEGGGDEPAVGERRLWRVDARVWLGRNADPAARAGGRVRPLDGLRGVLAQPHPRALCRDRRYAHARSSKGCLRARLRSRARR